MVQYYADVCCKGWKDLICEILQDLPFIKPLHQER